MSELQRASLGVVLLAATAIACGDDTSTGGGGQGGAPASGGSAVGGAGGAGGSDAGIQIDGLTAAVRADVDDNGIWHLHCAADDDCFAALGYFHAANRFFFMDFVRNSVRGKLGKLVKAGDVVLQQDYDNRRFFATADGTPLEEKLYDNASSEVQGHLDAYTKGVNAWIGDMRNARNGATLTTEYDFNLIVKENIRDWEPEDSAAVGLYVLNDLSNNSAAELEMATALPAFDPALAPDLFSARPVFDAFTAPSGTANAAPASPGEAQWRSLGLLFTGAVDHLRRVGSGAPVQRPGEVGSNNWVVGPTRSASGNPLLANDPHLLLTNPSIWFPVELDAKSEGSGTYHLAGSTFPGLPSVMVGHNESIGWGVTTAYYDLADEYVEQVSADGTTVLFNGDQVPIVEKEFAFEDAASNTTIMKTFRWVPHHGPIVSEDAAAHTALTIRWRGHDAGTDLDAFFAVGRAGNMEEARQGIELASSANQNFVIVDKAGSFGWFPYSQVPSRPWASTSLAPWLPLPGDGTAEWGEPVPVDDLPQLSNPDTGVIATSNEDMTGASADGDLLNDGQAALQAYSKADGTREQRILDLLEAGGSAHSVDTMHAMQGDTYSLYGSFIAPILVQAATTMTLTADEQVLVDSLAAWQFTCPTGVDGTDPVGSPDVGDADVAAEAIGCTAFHAALFAVVQDALGDEIAASGVELTEERWDLLLVARALKDPTSIASGDLLWDDVTTDAVIETRDDILHRGISDAAAVLAAMGTPNDWRWGRVHTLTLRSIYDSFGLENYNEGPYAASGGLFTINVANPSSKAVPDVGDPWNFEFAAGPSVRFVIEAGPDGPRMTYELPGGSDLHRESPFYNNLLPKWLSNEPVDFPFGPDAVANPALEFTVAPAN